VCVWLVLAGHVPLLGCFGFFLGVVVVLSCSFRGFSGRLLGLMLIGFCLSALAAASQLSCSSRGDVYFVGVQALLRCYGEGCFALAFFGWLVFLVCFRRVSGLVCLLFVCLVYYNGGLAALPLGRGWGQ